MTATINFKLSLFVSFVLLFGQAALSSSPAELRSTLLQKRLNALFFIFRLA